MHLGEMPERFKPQYMAVFSITKYPQALKIARSRNSRNIVLVGVGEM